ncbi:MAG: HTTM domain-containing protein, partial [Planctomycetes bacterium]|nr:HTTM domain-containing protein [Planctomycetota bacterium]
MTQADQFQPNSHSANHDARGSSISPLRTFAGIWACATLVHLLSFPFWARTWQGWVLILAVGLTLAQPRSLPRFTFMIVASLTNLFRQMPFVPNHILFEGMVNLTILISIVWTCWKSREQLHFVRSLRTAIDVHRISLVLALGYLLLMVTTQHESVGGIATVLMVLVLDKRFSQPADTPALSTDIYQHFAPIVRIQVVLMYFWAVIQKLNGDYLDPAVSAATVLQKEIAERIPILPAMEWTLPFGIWGSLLFEAGIPILLLFRRTRFAGFVAAVFFHLLLAIHPHPGIFSYSALIFGVLVLFLPEPARLKLHEEWDRQRAALSRKLHVSVTPQHMATFAFTVFYIAITIFGIVYRLRGETRENFDLNCLMASYVWFAWGIWMGYCYIRAMSLSRSESRSLSSRLIWSPALVGILLVVCNGMSPWVGLKTQTSFSMFSNLRTEFAPNHLF